MICPICRKPTVFRFRPFCSKRCADVDLGKWFNGDYAVPSNEPEDIDADTENPDRLAQKPD